MLFYMNHFFQVKSENTSNRTTSIIEYKMPDITGSPLFPIYDNARNAIWVGDSKINSSRLWKFNIDSKEFVEYKINIRLITSAGLDSDGNIWYLDPVSKLLGRYNPVTSENVLLHIPVNGTLSSLILDPNGNVWISVSSSDYLLKYEVNNKNFSKIKTPTPHSSPLGMSLDRTGGIWVAEAIGKIARIEPSTNKIIEYSPSDVSLKIPTDVKPNPDGSIVYISEHGEDAIFAFDIKNHAFTRYVLGNDPLALPFGMAFDGQGNLWIAEHTRNKITIFEPGNGSSRQVMIPNSNPLTQWLVSDSKGRIWLAEPGEAALGVGSESTP